MQQEAPADLKGRSVPLNQLLYRAVRSALLLTEQSTVIEETGGISLCTENDG